MARRPPGARYPVGDSDPRDGDAQGAVVVGAAFGVVGTLRVGVGVGDARGEDHGVLGTAAQGERLGLLPVP